MGAPFQEHKLHGCDCLPWFIWSDMADVLAVLVLEPQSCISKVAAAVLGRSGVAAVLAWRGAAAELTKRAVPSWSGIAPSRYVGLWEFLALELWVSFSWG